MSGDTMGDIPRATDPIQIMDISEGCGPPAPNEPSPGPISKPTEESMQGPLGQYQGAAGPQWIPDIIPREADNSLREILC